MQGITPLPTVLGPQGPVGDTGGGGSAFGSITWNTSANLGSTSTFYLFPNEGAQDTTEYFQLAAGPGTYTTLKVISSLALSPDTVTFTLRLNGVDTGLTVTLAAGATTATGTGSVTVVEGDLLSMKMVQSGSTVSATRLGVGIY